MVDNMNPSSQFHPYQKPDTDTPAAPVGGLQGMLGKLGIDTTNIVGSLNNVASSETVTKARTFARNNGALVLGGLAVAAIGAGLLRRRNS